MLCPRCGAKVENDSFFCSKCGTALGKDQDEAQQKPDSSSILNKKMATSEYWLNQVNQYMGNEQPSKLDWKVLFTDVFKPHTTDEAERIFISGTKTTTPPAEVVSYEWPRPWLYARVLLMFLITSFLLWFCCTTFKNGNCLPGFIVVSSFAVPFATLILFLELNVWRNISLYQIFKIFFIGGCASLVVTLLLFAIINGPEDMNYVGAFTVGIIEELGKAFIVMYFVRKLQNRKILPAMLIGSCVGAGFAAFESAGYAFRSFMGGGWDSLMHVLLLRGILAPGGHVAWAAMSGAAIVIASKAKDSSMEWGLLGTTPFLRLFIIPIILHGLWDSPLVEIFNGIIPYSGQCGLIFLAWLFILVLCNMGLSEVNKETTKKLYP